MSGLGKDRHISKELKNLDNCTDLEDYQGQLDVAHRYTIVAFWVKDLLCKRTTDEGYEVDGEIAEVSRVIGFKPVSRGSIDACAGWTLDDQLLFRCFCLQLYGKQACDKMDFDHEVRSSLLPAALYKVSDTEK